MESLVPNNANASNQALALFKLKRYRYLGLAQALEGNFSKAPTSAIKLKPNSNSTLKPSKTYSNKSINM